MEENVDSILGEAMIPDALSKTSAEDFTVRLMDRKDVPEELIFKKEKPTPEEIVAGGEEPTEMPIGEDLGFEFNLDSIESAVNFQKKFDPNGLGQEPTVTDYWSQVGRAYEQAMLTDVPDSEYNQYERYIKEDLKLPEEYTNRDKDDVKFFLLQTNQKERAMMQQTFNNGDWGYDEYGDPEAYTKDGEMVLGMVKNNLLIKDRYFDAFKVLNDSGLNLEQIHKDVVSKTREEWKNYNSLLDIDRWYNNIGSQVLGNVGAYLTSPINQLTLAGEILIAGRAFSVGSKALRSRLLEKSMKKADDEAGDILMITPEDLAREQKRIKDFETTFSKGKAKEEMKALMYAEGGVAAVGSALSEYLTYDWKAEVLPEYDIYDSGMVVGLSTGLATLLPVAGRFIGMKVDNHYIQKTMDEQKLAVQEMEAMEKDAFKMGEEFVDMTDNELIYKDINDVDELATKFNNDINYLTEMEKCFMSNK